MGTVPELLAEDGGHAQGVLSSFTGGLGSCRGL